MAALPTLRILLVCVAAALAAGCAAVPLPRGTRAPSDPAFDGFSGERVPWAALIERAAAADIVVLGETHDDARAHALQLAVYEDLASRARHGAAPPALALEMLERHHQPLVGQWLGGSLATDQFVEAAGVANWAGPGTWAAWYQPLLDAARSAGAPVFAANAPRRIVRMAWTEGPQALEALGEEDRRLFAMPIEGIHDDYRARFLEAMGSHMGEDPETVEAMFLSQLVWDATMAETTARAADASRPAVLLVGRFHSDFEGGLVGELRARRPDLALLVVSFVPEASDALRGEDYGRADVVVYTGR